MMWFNNRWLDLFNPEMAKECATCSFPKRYHWGRFTDGHLIHRPDLCEKFQKIEREMVKAA